MVKATTFLAGLAATLTIAAEEVWAQCRNPIVRREWNELSNAEKQAYVDAHKRLAARPISGQYRDPSRVSHGDFVATHAVNAGIAHANAIFYPYHRAMLAVWERALATAGWTGGAVYWDWSAVSQNWWESDIFRWFGTQGTGSDRCVASGPFASGQYAVSKDPGTGPGELRDYAGNPTCLRRCGSPGQVVTDATTLSSLFELATDYTTFRGDDSRNFHAIGHIVVGGTQCDMGNFYFSPNDPLFFLHHAMVDKIWWKWQNLCPNFKTDYEGFLATGEAASTSQTLLNWPYTAGDVLDTQGGVLCYTYSRSAGDIPHGPNPGCRQTPTSSSSSPQPTSTSSSSPAGAARTRADPNPEPSPAPAASPAPSNSSTVATTTRPANLNNAAFGQGNGSLAGINFGNQGLWFQDLIMSLYVVRGTTPLFAKRDEGAYAAAADNVPPARSTVAAHPQRRRTRTATRTTTTKHPTPHPIRSATSKTRGTDAAPTLPTTTRPYSGGGGGRVHRPDRYAPAPGFTYYHYGHSTYVAGTRYAAATATEVATEAAAASTTAAYAPAATSPAAIDPTPEESYSTPKHAPPLPDIVVDTSTNATLVAYAACTIPIPAGYTVHRAYADMVVVYPVGYVHDPFAHPKNGAMGHGGNGPRALHCPKSVEEVARVAAYTRPEGLDPPPAVGDNDVQRIRYPPAIPEAYAAAMGLDLYRVRKAERDAMYAVDRCNKDPECVSPSRLEVARDAKADLSFNAKLEVEGVGRLAGDGRGVER
ncbi:hypothetical protein HDU96_009167, partial [Phlyctochytrium bullatum]